MSIDVEAFKAGMRRLAGGVCLITTETPEGDRNGMTATAVCSVSISPATLLCCINRQSVSCEAIARSGVFAVSVLATEDRPLADHFARVLSGADKFARGAWLTLTTRAPVLETALAGFDCRVSHTVEVGSHCIVLGDILAVHLRKLMARPLLYAHGAYGGFEPVVDTPHTDSSWTPPDGHELD